MLVYAPLLVRVVTANFARAITLYPFVLIRRKEDKHNQRLLNHERIHLKQQKELWVLPFYICYLWEYLKGRLSGKNHYQAYRNISFEKEAFGNENDSEYLSRRKRLAFRRYR